MEKGEKNLTKEELTFLSQLIKALGEARVSLEQAYERKDYDNFNKSKKFLLQIQNKILEIIE